jgi:two-component system response regulator FixJ
MRNAFVPSGITFLKGGRSGMAASDFRIYLVDNDKSVRRALGKLLKSSGYRVETFASGPIFLRSVPFKDNAILILDVALSEMNGLALQRHLQEKNWDAPVIFITGCEEPGLGEHAQEQGAVAFLKKPFRDLDLLEAIQVSIERLNKGDR